MRWAAFQDPGVCVRSVCGLKLFMCVCVCVCVQSVCVFRLCVCVCSGCVCVQGVCVGMDVHVLTEVAVSFSTSLSLFSLSPFISLSLFLFASEFVAVMLVVVHQAMFDLV